MESISVKKLCKPLPRTLIHETEYTNNPDYEESIFLCSLFKGGRLISLSDDDVPEKLRDVS